MGPAAISEEGSSSNATLTATARREQEGAASNAGVARPIPLLAVNLDFDTEDYLTRLVAEGWEAGPSGSAIARHKLVVAGGCDPLVL